MIQSEILNQAGRKVQRMRNILVILAMFVCTSICLGDTGQTITIDGDIVDRQKASELEQKLEQLKPEQQVVEQMLQMLQQQESQQLLLQHLQQQESQQHLQQNIEKQLEELQEDEQLLELLELKQQLEVKQQLLELKQILLELKQNMPLDQLELIQRILQKAIPLLEVKQQLLEKQLASVKYSDIAGNGNPNKGDKYKHGKALDGDIWNNPNNNHLIIINPNAKVGNAYGAKMNKASVVKSKSNKDFLSMTNNDVIVSGGKFGCGDPNGGNIAGAYADDDIDVDMNISSNTVIITGGTDIKNVFGGRTKYGTVSSNTVTISNSVTIGGDVLGAKIGEDGLASSNTVTITSGTVKNVYGGYIVNNGTATLNTVNLTSVTVRLDVFGARIGMGLASSNTVTITSGTVGLNVYGGYIHQNGTATLNKVNLTKVTVGSDVYGAKIIGAGLASSNTVTISGGKVKGNVFGGYVGGNGEATYNTINITASELSSPEFSPESILCGGICATIAATNDAFTGNTLNIETKGVVVKGISNFEKYKFNLKDIKAGETILTATSGGYNEANKSACEMDLSRSNISLHTQGVLNKGDYYTLIRSQKRFKDNVKYKKFDFENEGLLIKYYWEVILTDDGQNLTAKLTDKKVRDEGIAKSLSEGYGAGVACINNGMDFIISNMEGTGSLLGEQKGEIGVFGGVAANKSRYNISKGSHIDMIGMSMMGGVGKVVEVRERELTAGVFVEHGTGNSDIYCKKKSEGKSSYTGVGLLGRYNIYKNEFSGTKGQSPKLYVEAILRAGQVGNSFNGKEAKDSTGKEYKYDDTPVMYGGCEGGVGYKEHKLSGKMDLDWSLRYMFGYQDGRNVEKPVDADGNKVKFESVTSSRIKVGVRGTYRDIEQIKPYVGIGCEHELGGKIKAVVQDGKDQVKIPAPSFEGWTDIVELGASGKVWKLGVDISGQGYLGKRKGFGGMLKLKYAFGKDAHGSLASSKASSLASSKAPIS